MGNKFDLDHVTLPSHFNTELFNQLVIIKLPVNSVSKIYKVCLSDTNAVLDPINGSIRGKVYDNDGHSICKIEIPISAIINYHVMFYSMIDGKEIQPIIYEIPDWMKTVGTDSIFLVRKDDWDETETCLYAGVDDNTINFIKSIPTDPFFRVIEINLGTLNKYQITHLDI